MKEFVAGLLVMVVGLGPAIAGGDPIKERRDLMKASGAATKTIVGMLKGAPFDLEAIKAALKTYADDAAKSPTLFPDGSNKGDTNALPAIWDNKADFVARFSKFADDVNVASTVIVDEASFRATAPRVLNDCGGCHELYRAKKY